MEKKIKYKITAPVRAESIHLFNIRTAFLDGPVDSTAYKINGRQ